MTANRAATDASVAAFLGLGSNLGDREAALQFACERLARTPGIAVEAVSTFKETAPVGGPPQGPFLNAAVRVRTRLSPQALLAIGKAIEREAGRKPGGPRSGPRELDVDVLLYGDLVVDEKDLVVPHPRLLEREFALDPLRELGVEVRAIPRETRPIVLREPGRFAARCDAWRRGACTLGLVPTMGALHEGHASLLRAARQECDRVAATIFVNPLQFAPHEDLSRYPRPFEADLALCAREGVDVVFAPPVEAMYGDGFASRIAVGPEAAGMEGAVRPEHFSGVATVVTRLWSLARPDVGYFGEKDAQQLAVLRRVHEDLGLCGAIRGCPTVREPDGLAMSSRNVYLSPMDRAAAAAMPRALAAAKDAYREGLRDAARLVAAARAVLLAEPRCRGIDYVELRAPEDLAPLGEGPVGAARLLIAARFGEPATRLLDNARLDEPSADDPIGVAPT